MHRIIDTFVTGAALMNITKTSGQSNTMYLTKSNYRSWFRCPKRLWMDKYRRGERLSIEKSPWIEIGNIVENNAKELFGNSNPEVPRRNISNAARARMTKKYIDEGAKFIYEAAFLLDGDSEKNPFCSVDILRINKGKLEIIEVKGKTDKDKKVMKRTGELRLGIDDIDMHDMAYQYHVVTNAGFSVSDVSIMRLSSNYRFQNELDLSELFAEDSCLGQVLELQDEIPVNITNMRDLLSSSDTEPDIIIGGNKCGDCGYFHLCWSPSKVPRPNAFEIGFGKPDRGISQENKTKAFTENLSFAEIYDRRDELGLNNAQRKQVKTLANPDIDHDKLIEKDKLKEFLNNLEYPIYHLDFETYNIPIPMYNGDPPNLTQVPFQYSLHVQLQEGEFRREKIDHIEFLAEGGTDPRQELAVHMFDAFKKYNLKKGTILTYNMSFERSVILKLAERFENYPDVPEGMCDFFRKITDKETGWIADLMVPFGKGHYYHSKMGKSYSLKVVVPALLGYDPYAELTGVTNGGDALETFPILSDIKDPEELHKKRQELLDYCCLDTWVMVEILEKLTEIVND